MAVNSWSHELSSQVAPVRLFRALTLDSHNLFPKLMPDAFKSIEFVKGDRPAVGSVRRLNFPEGSPFKYAIHRIEEIDIEKLYCKYSMPEGDILGDTLENVVNEVKFMPSGTGSICAMSSHYHPKGGATVDPERLKTGQVKATELFKKVEGYLLSNPNAYA